jgi:zinc transporter ZupT
MTPLVMLAALAVIPLLAILLLRVNGAIAFMSLCLGSVLVTYTSGDVDTVFTSFATKDALATNQWVQLALLVVPFLLTVLFTRRSVKKGLKSAVNFLPALATGLLCVLFVVPLLPSGLQHQLQHPEAWHQLSNAQTGVILGGAVSSLVFLLLTHRKRKSSDEEEGKKKKHGKH